MMKAALVLCLILTSAASAQTVRWGPANWALSSASSGGGTSLPAAAAGVLLNDGANNLSWGPCLGYAATVWTLTNCTLSITVGAGTSMLGQASLLFDDSGTGSATFAGVNQQAVMQSSGAGDSNAILRITASNTPTITWTADDEDENPTLPVEVGAGVTVSVKTQADSPVTVTLAQSGTRFCNTGATAQVVFNLPTALAGLHYVVCSIDSDGVQVVANTGDTITYGASTSGAAGNITATSGCATFSAFDATRWLVESATSTWTVSAP